MTARHEESTVLLEVCDLTVTRYIYLQKYTHIGFFPSNHVMVHAAHRFSIVPNLNSWSSLFSLESTDKRRSPWLLVRLYLRVLGLKHPWA